MNHLNSYGVSDGMQHNSYLQYVILHIKTSHIAHILLH